MTIKQAVQFLKVERPKRPYKLYGYQKQQAIDLAIKALESWEEDNSYHSAALAEGREE